MELAIGLMIGSVLGLTGAGGSVFAVPLLVLFTGMATTEAIGLALGTVAVSAAIGAYRQRTLVCWWYVWPLIVGGVLAAPLGQWAAAFINETALVLGFSGIALTIAIRMLQQARSNPTVTLHIRPAKTPTTTNLSVCESSKLKQLQGNTYIWAKCIVAGLVVGFASGLFGVGGGFLIVPLLILWGEFSMPQAIASSLAAIVFISGSGFVSHYLMTDFENANVLLKLLIAAIAGMLLSQSLSLSISEARLQKVFAVLLMLVSIMFVWKQAA